MDVKCTKVPPQCPKYRGGRCSAIKKCKHQSTYTNADRIRAMSDEELAQLLCTADWREVCDQMRQSGVCYAMELDGPLNQYCVAAGLRWLQQPAPEEGEQNV